MSTVPELLAGIRTDVSLVEDMARWAWIDGWSQTGPDPDRTSRPLPMETRDLQRIGQANADEVPGPAHDLGIGDHSARTAYRASAEEVRQSFGALILAAHAAGARRRPNVDPWPAHSRPELGQLLTALEAMRQLLDLVDAGDWPALVRTRLRDARRTSFRAWQRLHAWDSRGRRGPERPAQVVVDKKKNCKVCGIRPRKKGEGGRCGTCGQYFRRHEHERPEELDPFHSARAAQAKRLARGETHGDESLSGARGA